MVVSKLDEAVLRQIAVLTGGAYIRSTNQSLGLAEIIQKVNETEQKEFTTQFEEYNELFQWFLGASLLVLLFELVILTRKNHLLARFNIFKKE
jgi:Ca-activated chloride channel family protein